MDAGHYSTIVKQLRGKAKPDGMVLVVGGCATGEVACCYIGAPTMLYKIAAALTGL